MEMFRKIDTDDGGEISYDEFEEWIKGDKDLQEFILRYTGVQTMEHASSRYNEQLNAFKDIFDFCSVDMMGDQFAKISDIKTIFNKALS